jgi:hypothetical protein
MTASVKFVLRNHAHSWKLPTQALEFQPDERQQNQALATKLSRWRSRSDSKEWKPVWLLDGQRKPWPIFVHLADPDRAAEPGIADEQFTEVFEWDPELDPQPTMSNPASIPNLIIGGPPLREPGWLERVKLKFY